MLLFRSIQLMLEGNLFVPDLSYIVGLLYLFVNSLVNCDVLRKKISKINAYCRQNVSQEVRGTTSRF